MRRELGYQLDKLELMAGQFCDWLTTQGKKRPSPLPTQ